MMCAVIGLHGVQGLGDVFTSWFAVLLSLLALLATAWLYRRWRWASLDLMKIPKPWGDLPVLGHVVQMALHVHNGHEQFLKWHEAYGDIVRIRILHRDIVLIADPKSAADVLAKGSNECARRTPEYKTFDVGHGMPGHSAILTEQNEERWRAIRRTIAPAYSLSVVREVFPTIVKCYASVCEGIASGAAVNLSAGKTSHSTTTDHSPAAAMNSSSSAVDVHIDDEIFGATIRLTAEGFLRMCQDQISFDVHRVAADASALVAIVNTFVSQPWKKWLYLAIPGLCKESRAFHSYRNHLMAVTHQIAEYIINYRPAPETDNSLAACLSRLTEPSGAHKGQLFSREALQAEVFLQLIGQESIPWTVAWSLYLLTQYPEAQSAVVQELQSAGIPCNGDLKATVAALNMDVLKQLPYCTAVLHEALRMFPSGVAATPRLTEKITQVGPYKLPAGVIVFPCLYSILMYSKSWDNPRTFDPSRWLDDPNYATDPRTGAARFVPFGIGPKACIAQHLAMVQCKVLLVLLVSCFSWELSPRMGGPAGVLAQTVAALELRVAQGMWLRPTPRL
eukprot:GHUV01001001.1.p1 GENE.GHUV01001001.1~~GHUV01001001.1.p1  ORF type:complete len:563 (+),score=98.44 GHUV01001001.1:141-1829(+)